MMQHIKWRRLGRAENGWLLLIPGNAEVGDRLVTVEGRPNTGSGEEVGRAG